MMDEHQLNWKEMANIMMKINKQQGEGEGGCQVVPCNYEINQIPGG